LSTRVWISRHHLARLSMRLRTLRWFKARIVRLVRFPASETGFGWMRNRRWAKTSFMAICGGLIFTSSAVTGLRMATLLHVLVPRADLPGRTYISRCGDRLGV